VDDNCDLLRTVTRALRAEGFAVTSVNHRAGELDDLLHNAPRPMLHPPDVFFIDLDSSRPAGERVSRSIRNSRHAQARIIAVSGGSHTLRWALQSGLFEGTLAKPFDLNELIGHALH
jgi:CheY-like chemotaxis protein